MDTQRRIPKSVRAAGTHGFVIVASVVGLGTLFAAVRGEVVRLAVFGTLIVAGSIAVARWRFDGGERDHVGTGLVFMWVLVTIGPMHTISNRPLNEAVRTPGTDAMVEIAAYALVAACCALIVRHVLLDVMTLRPPLPLIIFPLFAVASTAWSSIATYSFGKGVLLLVIAMLATTTITYFSAGGDVRRILTLYLRSVVGVSVALLCARLAFGPLYILARGADLERFSFIGMHPNVSASLLSISMWIVVSAPSDVLPLRPVARVVLAAALVPALISMQSRTSLAMLLVALMTLLVASVRRSANSWIRYATPVGALAGILVIKFWDGIASYLYRGGDSSTLTGGNGRWDLWARFLRELSTPFDVLFGLGYGKAKIVLLDDVVWAKGGHSSFLAVIVGLGAIGLVVYVGFLAYCARVVVSASRARPALGPLLVGLLSMLLTQMLVSDSLAEPGGGLSLLYLLVVVSLPYQRALFGRPADVVGSSR